MNKFVVIAPNWLGDAAMSLPLVGLLGEGDSVRLAVAAPAYTSRVYLGLQGVDELVVFDRSKGMRGAMSRARILRALEGDAAIILPPSFSSALSALLSGARVRVGFDTDGRRALLTHPVSRRAMKAKHLSRSYMDLGARALEAVGLGSSGMNTPRPVVLDREREELQSILERKGLPDVDYALVVPGAAYGEAKMWPTASFRALVGMLAHSLPVVLSGGAGERSITSRIAESLPDVFDLSGETTGGTLLALMERASVVIANDSGPPHLAAALGTPVVVLFGSTSPTWTSPLGEGVEVIHHPVECSPCFLRDCPRDLECFRAIEPEEVLEKVSIILKKRSKRAL